MISLQLVAGTPRRQLKLDELGEGKEQKRPPQCEWEDQMEVDQAETTEVGIAQQATRSTDWCWRAGVIAQGERMLARTHLTGGRKPWCRSNDDGGLGWEDIGCVVVWTSGGQWEKSVATGSSIALNPRRSTGWKQLVSIVDDLFLLRVSRVLWASGAWFRLS